MKFLVYKIISTVTAIICAFSSVFGTPVPRKVTARQFAIPGDGSCYAGDGRVSVHDPSIIQDKDGAFYVFGSHGCAGKSTDLRNFENVACGVHDNNRMLVPEGRTIRDVLKEPLSWTDTYQEMNGYDESQWETTIWAADVIYNKTMGKYCYYACSSIWGKPHSVIWFGTSDNIEGPYEHVKGIVYSGMNNIIRDKLIPVYPTHYSFTNVEKLLKKGVFSYKEIKNAPFFLEDGTYNFYDYPNAIDPTVFYDKDEQLWMVYGSYSGGIYIMPLDEFTGEPDYKYMRNTEGYDIYFGKRLSRANHMNEGSGEGPYITYDPISDYYYLYISYSALHSLGGYNIREYRSKNVDGPYIDATGNNALDYVNSGVKLFGNYKFDCLDTAYLAGGHSSGLVTEDGKIFHVYHTRFNSGHEGHQVRVHQMARTENGWTVVLPFEYAGEVIGNISYSTEEICGDYEFINHGTISNGCTNWEDVNNIIAPTQSITLNPDGTITNLKRYESIKENTAVSSKDVSGNWKIKDGTYYAVFIIDGVTYEGVFCNQKDESKEKTEKLVFSAMGNNNECIWGVKKEK